MHKIRITSGDLSLTATLNDSQTSQLIWNALPIVGRVQTWGDEIYFPIPVSTSNDETAADVVDKGGRGVLAAWQRAMPVLGPNAGEPRRRDQARKPSQCLRNDRRRCS